MAEAEQRFDVMGTKAHLLVTTGHEQARADALVHVGAARLRDLHDRWTRFEPTSDVGRANTNAGEPVEVHRDTLLLFERACDAWRATDGRFDPTVLAAVVDAGYDRDFQALATAAIPAPGGAGPAPGCAEIIVDWSARTVTLPRGVGFDPGGIGKGLAADLVARELLDAGAQSVCVNVGGDIHALGPGPAPDDRPSGDGWLVELEHPLPGHAPIGVVRLRDHVLVSTWRTRRAWNTPDGPGHHLIDPATGRSAWTGLAGVCVLTREAAWAEVLAKAAFLAGPEEAAALLRGHRAHGFLIRDDGAVRAVGAAERFLA